jgi:hypothetical protein
MPPGWAATRRRILARDSWTCRLQLTGCTRQAAEVHHLERGNEADALLVAVCHSCHQVITAQQAAAARRAARP